MSALLLALIGGPIGGLVLEAVSIWGTGRKVVTAGSAIVRLVKLIEKVKAKLDPSDQIEADEAIAEARKVQE
jgi:hypothetical protein